jgi:hypothetical protein
MKNLIKNNGIILAFLFTQLLLFCLALQNDSIIGNNYNINKALIFHFFIVLLVLFGYSIKKIIVINYSNIVNSNNDCRLKKGFFIFCLVLIIIGLLTSILTVGSIISPQEYLTQLASKDEGIAEIRQQAGDGGLGGIFKMLNYCPLAIYLITSSYLNFFNFKKNDIKKVKEINAISLGASLIKVLFSLDRLTILAILLVQIYTNVIKKKLGLKFLIVVSCILTLGGFVTASRMSDSGLLDFLVVYCKLSLVNFQMVIDNQADFSYGFQTLLSPFSFIAKFFGIALDIPSPNVWVWNPAQYFNSYLFMDYGYLSFFLYPLIGYFINYVEIKKRRGCEFYTSFYFVLMFTITTFISVPFLRGMEFWVLILICIMLSKFIVVVELTNAESV